MSAIDPHQFLLRFDTPIEMLLVSDEGSGDCITWHEATLVHVAEDETEEVAGFVRGFVIDGDRALNEHLNILEECDADDGTTEAYGSAFFDSNGEFNKSVVKATGVERSSGGIVAVDLVVIKPAFRGHRLGLLCLRRFIDKFGRGCVLAACELAPAQFDDEGLLPDHLREALRHPETDQKRATEALARYVANIGFERIPRTPYMARSLELVQPSMGEIISGPLPWRRQVGPEPSEPKRPRSRSRNSTVH